MDFLGVSATVIAAAADRACCGDSFISASLAARSLMIPSISGGAFFGCTVQKSPVALIAWHSFRDEQDENAVDRADDATERKGEREAHRGQRALRRLLQGAERRSECSCAGDGAKQQRWMKFEHVFPDEQADDHRQERDDDPVEDEANAVRFEAFDQAGSRVEAYPANESTEGEVVEHPERRSENASEREILGVQVSSDESGQQHPDARAES